MAALEYMTDRTKHSATNVQCIQINPAWSKGYARKGAALHGQRRYDEGIAAYEEGLRLEDSPALKKGLQEIKDAKGMFVSYTRYCGS